MSNTIIVWFVAVCMFVAACVSAPQPTRSPISPLASPRSVIAPGVLINGGFDLASHYQPKGETSMVLPTGWKAWSLDEKGWLKLYEPSGMRTLGQYREYEKGLRPGQDSYILKAEILHICRVSPYLDPPRIFEGECSVTGFKLYGHLAFGVQQTFATIPGHVYRFDGAGHAWSRMAEDPGDAHYSRGAGTGPFYREEGDPALSDYNDNFMFRLCVDPFGAENRLGGAVQCGTGAVIYNEFHAIPLITFTARADSVTVFGSVDTRYGFVNSNGFLDSFFVQDITPPPTPTPTPTPTHTPEPTFTPTITPTVGPTVTPIPVTPGMTLTCQLTLTQRVYVLLPPASGVEWYKAAVPIAAQNGWSIGASAVDACVNSCGQRIVIVVNAERWGCNLYPACRAPCGSLRYIPLSAPTPEDLALALERYPLWLKEAWGICFPAMARP